MNEDKSEIHSGIAVAIIFSIAAIIMSICSLARNNERVLGFDYLGVIVGILTLLVTFLVAWQIWQTIDAKNTLEKFENRTKEYDVKIDGLRQELESKTMLLSAQGERMSFLIDGHSRQHSAQNENILAASYRMYAEAVEMFIRSWMPPMYDPLQASLLEMTNILDRIENNPKQWKMFVDDENIYDSIHDNIVNAINQHQMALEGIIDQVRVLNRNRHRIINNIRPHTQANGR